MVNFEMPYEHIGRTGWDSSTNPSGPMLPYTVPPEDRNTSLRMLFRTQISSRFKVPITFDWTSNSGDSFELFGVVVLTQWMTALKPGAINSSRAPTSPKSPVKNVMPGGDRRNRSRERS